jgi:hypothetical protein
MSASSSRTSWAVTVGAAGGCRHGGVPSDVVGDALVIEDSTTSTGKALKAAADCMIEGVNTYQYGGELHIY